MKKMLIAVIILPFIAAAELPAPFTKEPLRAWTEAAQATMMSGCFSDPSSTVALCQCHVRGIRVRYTEADVKSYDRLYEQGRPNAAFEKWVTHVVKTCSDFYAKK
jgi:hypothetical protein